MLHLYHLPGSRSARVVWALEELGCAYELILVDRDAGDLATEAFRKLNPFGRIPVLVDPVRKLVMSESGAIIEYLLEVEDGGALHPEPGTSAWAEYLQWLHAAETIAAPASWFLQHTMRLPEAERVPAVAAAAKTQLMDSLGVVDAVLADRPYIVGETFSAADIMVGYVVIRLGGLAQGLDNIGAYVERLQQRPACRIAFA